MKDGIDTLRVRKMVELMASLMVDRMVAVMVA